MTKKLRGFLIDPEAKTITQIVHNGDWRQINKMIGSDLFTVVTIDDRNNVFVDDEGLLNDPRYFFMLRGYPQPLAGKGLILGFDAEGETISSDFNLSDVEELVAGFQELSVLGFDHKTQENVEIMPGIKGTRISNRPIFGPPKDKKDAE